MTELLQLLISVLIAGLGAMLLIVCTHLLLWSKPWRLKRTEAYVVGVAELGLVLTIWGMAMDKPEGIIAFWGITGMAGFADLTAWWFRRRLGYLVDDIEDSAYARGQMDDGGAGMQKEPDHGRKAD